MSREAQEGFISSMFAEGGDNGGEQLSVDVSDMDEEAINALHVLLINNGFQASLYGDKLNVRRQGGEGGVSYTFAGLEFEGGRRRSSTLQSQLPTPSLQTALWCTTAVSSHCWITNPATSAP